MRSDEGVDRPAPLVVATWNVHSAVPVPAGERDVDESLALLADLRPDLLALQEIEFAPSSGVVSPSSAEIFEASGLPFRELFPLSPSHANPGRRLGIALASRWPLRNAWMAKLPMPAVARGTASAPTFEPHDKGLVVATVRTAHGDTVFGSVHVFPFHRFNSRAGDRRMAGVWDALAAAVDALPSHHPVLLAGDYNTEDRTLLTSRLSGRELASAAAGMPSRPTGQAFDDVLFSDAFTLLRCYARATFSDHHLVVAEFGTR